MKWIGQHIWDFISRFRGDVYIENLSTTTETDVLVVDSDGKVSKNTIEDLHHDTSSQASVDNSGSTYIQDVTLDTYGHVTGLTSAAIPTLNQSTTGQAGTVATIAGLAPNTATTQATQPNITTMTGFVTGSENQLLTDDGDGTVTSEANFVFTGSLATITGSTKMIGATPLLMHQSGNAADFADIALGAHGQLTINTTDGAAEAADVTINADGDIVLNSTTGIIKTGTTTFVNNSGVVQVATQGTIDHDSLANFKAVEHVDWAGASAGIIHPSNIPALGTLTNLNVDNININGDTITASADLSIVATGNDITIDTDNLVIESATDGKPFVELKSTTNSNKGSVLQFTSDKGAAGVDDDSIGSIIFVSDDDHPAQQQTTYAQIVGKISDASNTDEAGKLEFQVAESDGTTTTLTTGLLIEGEHATDGEVDVTIGAGAASTTTVSGNLAARETTVTNLITSGNIELGHATDTTITRSAAGKVTIQGNEIQTTNVHHHFLNAGFFLNFPYSRYIPLQGSLNEQNTATSSPEYVNFTWPYDGYVKTMWLRSETDMGNTELALYKGASGATVVTALGAVTESVSASNAVEFDFTSVTNSYSQGDTMAVRIDPTDDPDGGQNITIELIFDLTT